MSYSQILQDKTSSEAIALFLAIRTKNIYEIDHLVDKGYIPAILKRLEKSFKDSDMEKSDALKNKALSLLNEEDKQLFISDYNKLLDINLPKISKKRMLAIN
jgi:hypothetical protein